MCGRFVIASPPDVLRQLFGYGEQPNFPPRYNIAPTQPVPVVIVEQGIRRFRLMRWGLLPSWVKDPRAFTLLINARGETLLEKPAFRNAVRRRRCLVPADGYYEWQSVSGRKQPFFIHAHDRRPFGFAALAETWIGPHGEELDTVAIVTAAATGAMAGMHMRVPVTIAPDAFARWLDCTADDTSDVMPLLRAPAEGAFVWHRVSTRVNSVANDDAQLVLPISDDEIAAEQTKAVKPPGRRLVAAATRDDAQGSLF